MAELLGIDRATLEAVYEPWLVRRGFIERTERGRVATKVAAELRARFPGLGRNGNGNGNGNGCGNGNGRGNGAGNGNGLEGLPDTG